jgi:cytochrome d ubiquinol oxidase subunit I
MQTPAGYKLVDGQFFVTDFMAAIFNPSLPIRMAHMVMASFEAAMFAIAGISAYYLLKKKEDLFFRRSLGIALAMAALFVPLQVYIGDANGLVVYRHQPAKLAAMEAHWETNIQGGAPFVVVAWPDRVKEKNLFEFKIPNGLSLLLTKSFSEKVQGLKEFPPENRPPVAIVFWTFRLMVAIGFLFLLVMIWAAYLWRRGRLFETRAFLWVLVAIQPLGFLATELGWITTEVGRQPWLVYNLMRVSEGISPIPAGNVLWSIILFLVVFPVILASYFYYVFKTLRHGPDLETPIPSIQIPSGMRAIKKFAEERREE